MLELPPVDRALSFPCCVKDLRKCHHMSSLLHSWVIYASLLAMRGTQAPTAACVAQLSEPAIVNLPRLWLSSP